MIWIDRNVGAPSLQNGVDRNHEVNAPTHRHTDQLLRSDSFGNEVTRELIDLGIELRIRKFNCVHGQRDRVRRPRNLLVEQRDQRRIVRAQRSGRNSLCQYLFTLAL